jgi:hypothetical protein
VLELRARLAELLVAPAPPDRTTVLSEKLEPEPEPPAPPPDVRGANPILRTRDRQLAT